MVLLLAHDPPPVLARAAHSTRESTAGSSFRCVASWKQGTRDAAEGAGAKDWPAGGARTRAGGGWRCCRHALRTCHHPDATSHYYINYIKFKSSPSSPTFASSLVCCPASRTSAGRRHRRCHPHRRRPGSTPSQNSAHCHSLVGPRPKGSCAAHHRQAPILNTHRPSVKTRYRFGKWSTM